MTTWTDLAATVTSNAHTAWSTWAGMRTGDPNEAVTLTAAMYGHGLVYLLNALAQHAPDKADAIARDLADAWDDGGVIDDDLRRWSTYGHGHRCGTCDLPEDRWPVSDPLYIEGGLQCPGCTRFELNEEATRKHAGVWP